MHAGSAGTLAKLRGVESDDEVREALKPLLFGWHHEGVRRTGNVYPLGAFLLVANTVDVLAGSRTTRRRTTTADEVRATGASSKDFFPPQYMKLRHALREGLRSSPVHYFATTDVLFADGQPHHQLHLTRDIHGRVILHWPEFLRDYETARDKYWVKLASDAQLAKNAKARLDRRPLMTVEVVERPLHTRVPRTSFVSGATVMANPVASGSVRKP